MQRQYVGFYYRSSLAYIDAMFVGHVRVKFTSNIKITSRTPCRWFMSVSRSRTEKDSFSLSLFFPLPSDHLQRGKQPWKAINLACVSRRDVSARTARMLSRVFANRSKDHRQRGCAAEVALGGTLFIVERIWERLRPLIRFDGWGSWPIPNTIAMSRQF